VNTLLCFYYLRPHFFLSVTYFKTNRILNIIHQYNFINIWNNYFSIPALHFCHHTIYQVIWKSPVPLGGSISGWSLECELEHFTDVDTLWRVEDKLRLLSPDGDLTKTHVETLVDMISEAFYAHKRDMINARKKSSTAAESSEWQTDKSVNSEDFHSPLVLLGHSALPPPRNGSASRVSPQSCQSHESLSNVNVHVSF